MWFVGGCYIDMGNWCPLFCFHLLFNRQWQNKKKWKVESCIWSLKARKMWIVAQGERRSYLDLFESWGKIRDFRIWPLTVFKQKRKQYNSNHVCTSRYAVICVQLYILYIWMIYITHIIYILYNNIIYNHTHVCEYICIYSQGKETSEWEMSSFRFSTS